MKLLQTKWYRPGGRSTPRRSSSCASTSRCKPETCCAHLRARFESHPFIAAGASRGRGAGAAARDRSPAPLQAFTGKVRARARPRRRPRRSRLRAGEGLGQEAVQAGARPGGAAGDDAGAAGELGQARDSTGACRRSAGLAASGPRAVLHDQGRSRRSSSTAFRCEAACDPDNGNPILFTRAGEGDGVRRGARGDATSPTPRREPRRSRRRQPAPRRAGSATSRDELDARGRGLRSPQPPATTWLVDAAADADRRPTARRSATRGPGSVENWHQRAFTSFGDGHGVWEKRRRRGAAVLRAQLPRT